MTGSIRLLRARYGLGAVLLGLVASVLPSTAEAADVESQPTAAPSFWDPRVDVRLALDQLARAEADEVGPKWKEAIDSAALRDMVSGKTPPDLDALRAAVAVLRQPAAYGAPVLIQLGDSLEDWVAELTLPTQGDLPIAIAAAGDNFAAIDQAEVTHLRQGVDSAVRRAVAQLDPTKEGHEKEAALRDVLVKLQATLESADGDNLDELYDHADRLDKQIAKNGHARAMTARDMLVAYLSRLEVSRCNDPASEHRRRLHAMSQAVKTLATDPGPENQRDIARALAWIDASGRQRPIAYAVRRYFAAPNLELGISAEVLQQQIDQDFTKAGPVDDYILGAHVTGRQVTTAKATVKLVPDDLYACFDLVINGKCQVATTANAGRVTVKGTGEADFVAVKRAYFTPDGLASMPVTVTCDLTTRNEDIDVRAAPIIQGLAHRIAERAVAQQKAEGDRISEQKLKAEISQCVEDEAGPLLYKVDLAFRKQVLGRLIVHRNVLEKVRLHSTPSEIVLRARTRGEAGLAVVTEPPRPTDHQSVSLMVHESALNDLWNQVGGRPWPDPALQSEAVTTLVRDTSSSRSANPFDFASKSPVHWVLGTNRVTARVNVEDDPNDSGKMSTLEANYSLPVAAKALELVRDVSFDQLKVSSGEKNADQGAAEVLRQTIEKMFPQTLNVSQLLPGLETDEAPSGQLVVSRQLVDNGWLLLGWSRDEK